MTKAPHLLLALLLCGPAIAGAQVFRCADSTGKVQFSDKPCAAGQQASEVRIDKHPEPPPTARIAPEAAAYLKDRERRLKERAAANPGKVEPSSEVDAMRSKNYDVHKCVEARRKVAQIRMGEPRIKQLTQEFSEWERRADFYCGQ